jgi:hypothetical protein
LVMSHAFYSRGLLLARPRLRHMVLQLAGANLRSHLVS